MKLVTLICGFLSLATAIAGSRDYNVKYDDPEHDAQVQNIIYKHQYWANMNKFLANRTSGCTSATLEKRIEWDNLVEEDQSNYIGAINCLHTLPSQFSNDAMPGAKSRYDDFTGAHLLQTTYIHFSGLFLAFHRYFVYLFEQALQNECGYTGPTPYFDWSKWWRDPREAPFFGPSSALSFGGNGDYVPNREPIQLPIPGGPVLTFPPATGGGCIQDGAFTDFQLHLGPVVLSPQGPLNGTGLNPRCISRDISLDLSGNVRPSNITKLFGTYDLEEFNSLIDEPLGVHTSAHFMLGGIQLDPFVSPGDPFFWPHHGMIDYLWTVWQGQDLENRPYQVSGTETTGNQPPSPNVTLDSLINFNILADPSQQPIGNFISTVDGPFCYIYE